MREETKEQSIRVVLAATWKICQGSSDRNRTFCNHSGGMWRLDSDLLSF